ncbi:MAG: 30S ribosome-binding factor RbfA [Clostridiaceae bacterium]|nr:30S ribosome-binding factor RbfA [Clostridiaceae bacterium]
MSYNRIDRISEELKKELSAIIRELKDPRIPEMTSVVMVDVSRDLKYAKAYISVMGPKEKQREAIAGLKSASGFIRKEVGRRVQLRYTPEFTFILDDSIKHGAHIAELLNTIYPSEKEETKNDAKKDS